MPTIAETARDGRASGAGLVACSGHRMRVVGYVPDLAGTRADCDRPLRAVCGSCAHSEEWRCDSYGCGPCGETKRRRLIRVVEDGAGHQQGTGRLGYFLTVTAPGYKPGHLLWYQGKRPAHREVCGCETTWEASSLGEWNGQESANWNRLRTALKRLSGDMEFAGSVETQKETRYALHRHILIFTSERLEFAQVQELAIAAGYGCILDLEEIDSARKAARYLAKYVTKASGDRSQVPWRKEHVDKETGEITERRSPTYRLWSSSHHWGVTMKQVRDAARVQARNRAMYLRELKALVATDGSQLEASSDLRGVSPPDL